jgi:hypothetical protein
VFVELELLCEAEGEEWGWDGLVRFLGPVNGRLKELQGGNLNRGVEFWMGNKGALLFLDECLFCSVKTLGVK